MGKRKIDREPRVGEVVDLSHDGRGVCRHEGKTVFVADALPGETISYRLMQKRRSFDQAELLEVLKPSPDRVTPACAHFGYCGGCSLQHLDAGRQLEAKQKHLSEVFQRIGQLQPERWLEPLAGPLWGYRRRARLGVKHVHKKGRVLVGFRERGKPYVADIDSCEVLDPRVGQKLDVLAEFFATLDARDRLPQVEVACADTAVALVIRHLDPLSRGDLDKLRAFGAAHDFQIHLQSGGLDTVMALDPQAPKLVYALPEYSVDLEFTPIDFVQVNAQLNRAMIQQALDLLELQAEDQVLELFAGLGNFTLPMARSGARVIAVEGDAGLVARGRDNARRQGLDADYHVADLFEPQSQANWLGAGFNKVLLDPPRAGAEQILPAVLAPKPERVVYVSCHPASLARDARIVVDAGYRCESAGVMDMFPHTGHVESIASFVRA